VWENVSFKECSDVFFEYKFDGDMFMIKCELYSQFFCGGRVCVHGSDKMCELGSLKYDKGLLLLERTYPVSFLNSHGIEKEALTHFSIETSDGGVISSYPLGDFGSTLDKAQKLLDDMKVPVLEENAGDFVRETIEKIKRHTKENLPFLPEFEWYRVENEKETFSVSSIGHIISSYQFLQCFERFGFWYIGYKNDDSIFAVCINGGSYLPNPMENAIDCCVSFETDTEKYFVVGIGLFDDGQYFVRL